MKDLDQRLTSAFDKRTATALGTLDLVTVGDLLYHFPRRYLQFDQLSDLARPQIGEHLTVVARVQTAHARVSANGKHHMLNVSIADAAGHTLDLTFFSRAPGAIHGWAARLKPGTRAMFDGKVGEFNRRLQLANPRFEPIEETSAGTTIAGRAGMVLPLYPAGAKAPSWMIAKAVLAVLPAQVDDARLLDVLPPTLLAEKGWPTAAGALRLKHDPSSMRDVEQADERLKFEEAFVLQTALARRRRQAQALPATPRPVSQGGLLAAFDASLPFSLTAGQAQVGAQLAADLAGKHPMHRLLQGEVGSGKTIVALRAMLTVVDAGGQAALLAPTEVLAQQHYRSMAAMLGNLASAGMLPLAGPMVDDGVASTRLALLTGSQKAAERRANLELVASGEAGIIVGTHALLQEAVEFDDLGLVVVDEQHRFGVEQRDALRAKSLRTPHLLVMTATPIPRTVAMTVFGDLDTSTLTEVPAGREPVVSHVVPAAKPAWVQRMWQVVRAEVDKGRQAFVVCASIDPLPERGGKGAKAAPKNAPVEFLLDWESPAATGMSVSEMTETLQREPALDGVRLAMLHGRMSADDKEAAMAAFTAGEVDVLVATTVIEVGVDVPNASVMVIMDASRFGISQLHQLRGRVGRGGHPGFCFLVSGPATPESVGGVLQQVAATQSGFELARLDLEHRREGDVLGAKQSGQLSSLRVLRVTRDEDVIVAAREMATAVVAADPDLTDHRVLRQAIEVMLNPEREVFLERG